MKTVEKSQSVDNAMMMSLRGLLKEPKITRNFMMITVKSWEREENQDHRDKTYNTIKYYSFPA